MQQPNSSDCGVFAAGFDFEWAVNSLECAIISFSVLSDMRWPLSLKHGHSESKSSGQHLRLELQDTSLFEFTVWRTDPVCVH